MAITITLQPTAMKSWAPGTRHYLAADGTNLAVESMIDTLAGEIPGLNELVTVMVGDTLPIHQVVRPTVVFACTEEGLAVDLTPIQTFPPGTAHEAALTEMGYEVTG